MRNCLASSTRSGSAAMSAALTSRCSPLAVSVTTINGRRAARSTLTCASVSSFTIGRLSRRTPDGAPQDSPTFHAVSSATPNSSIFGWPLAITSSASVTTAPRRSRRTPNQEGAVIVDDEARACGARRRAPGFDHGGERHAVTGLLPVLGRLQNVFVAIEHGSLFKLRNGSGCGDAAAWPTRAPISAPRWSSNYARGGIRQRTAASF